MIPSKKQNDVINHYSFNQYKNNYILTYVFILTLFLQITGDGSGSHLKVIPTSQIYDVVYQVHHKERKHSGYRKVADIVYSQYHGITRSYIQEFCTTCPVCQLSQPQSTRAPLKPIVECEFLNRLQMDLIDMRNTPDEDYHYIGHVMDHFSKFHVLFPLKSKSADEVARLFKERVLAYFGPPHIFHTDNGTSFTVLNLPPSRPDDADANVIVSLV